MPAEVPQVSAEIIAFERVPVGGSFAFGIVPRRKFQQRVLVIALGIGGGGAFGGEVLEELRDEFVFSLHACPRVKRPPTVAETQSLLCRLRQGPDTRKNCGRLWKRIYPSHRSCRRKAASPFGRDRWAAAK